jgi:hypothetical protein
MNFSYTTENEFYPPDNIDFLKDLYILTSSLTRIIRELSLLQGRGNRTHTFF